MKKYLPFLLLLCSATAYAALNKWVDADGKVHYSDQPPPASVPAQTLRSSAAGGTDDAATSTPSAQKTLAEREAELRKAQQAKKEAAEKAALEQSNRETEQANCTVARQHLHTLQSGVRLMETGADGEFSYLDDAQRQQRIAKAQQSIEQWCK